MINKPAINSELLAKLTSYNSKISFPAHGNLERLAKKGTLVVATGQQVGLYISPVLAVYKALTAIKLAAKYEVELNTPVVPVFWLQTEDHDFDEIRTATILNSQGSVCSYELGAEQSKVPISERVLESQIEIINKEFTNILAEFPFGKNALELINSSYRENNDFGLSFAKMMSFIIGERGLVFLDPVRCEVTKFASIIYKDSLRQFDRIAKALRENTAGNQQVALRDDATLLFYRHQAERERLVRTEKNNFTVNNNLSLSQLDLEQKIDLEPQRFSASALLRPIIQDSILPTIAYIGGAAEIEYLKQCQVLYPIFNVIQAQAIKRPSITILDAKSKHWLDELKIEPNDLKSENLDKLIASKLLPSNMQPESLYNCAIEKINSTFNELDIAVNNVDKTLLNSSNKARERSIESLKLLIEKYTKAASLKDQVWHERLNKIVNLILPNSKPQERIISAMYFYARFGDEFVTTVFDRIDTKQISNDIEIIL